jgi:HK97 family phage prohead protease
MNTMNRNQDEGQFKLTMRIEKSYDRVDAEGVEHKYIAGIASGIALDKDSERMAETAIEAIKKSIDEGIILPNGQWSLLPLRKGHKKEWDDVLGWVVKAEIDSDYNLWIEAELDDTSTANDLYRKLTKGTKPGRPLQLGFSVGGRVLAADYEWNAELNKKVRVFKDIKLTEISVVGSPAYPTAYVEALEKSVSWDELPPDGVIVKEKDMSDLEKVTDDAVVDAAPITTKDSEEEAADAEKARRVIRENYSSSSSSETVIEDDEEDNTPESVTIMLSEKEKDNSEEVNKTESTDPTENDVLKMLQQLASDFAELKETVKALRESNDETVENEPEEETAKAEENADSSEELEKATVAEQVQEGIRKIVSDLKLDSIASELQALKASVEEIASEQIDKSISVNRQKMEEENDTPIEKFHKEINKDAKHTNPIAAAVRVGYQGKPIR